MQPTWGAGTEVCPGHWSPAEPSAHWWSLYTDMLSSRDSFISPTVGYECFLPLFSLLQEAGLYPEPWPLEAVTTGRSQNKGGLRMRLHK